MQSHSREIIWAGKKLKISTGKLARQAHGAVVVQYGDTVVLCTVCAAKSAKPDIDFFPLTVIYQEKAFAAGKIPGGFFKREGRPSEKETLTSRLIDRPIRPLFIKQFKNETQVVCTVLSHDLINDPDIPALIGSSAALTLSGLPFVGPVGGARVGMHNGSFILNPTLEEMKSSDLELIVAGTKEGVLMVESEAKELTEQQMLDAVMFAHEGFQPVIDMIIDLAEDCANDPWDIPEAGFDEQALIKDLKAICEADLKAAYKIQQKTDRQNAISAAKSKILKAYENHETYSDIVLGSLFKEIESEIVRQDILKTGHRIDGRDTKTVRQIWCETGLIPKGHGSALFTRGETQALVVATLGTGQDEQIIDALAGEYKDHFMLHYNFPPYSVGEVGRMGSPGRREMGHGNLAKRALNPMLPEKESFPYTLRIVSEILESNGSSSMATVCGATLALMDAGVPIKKPVAGIAMGLIKEASDYAILSDILGDEDHLGDMDFKVAGTKDGITSLQMDIKITSITKEIMEKALAQAKDGRIHILGEMNKALTAPKAEVSALAPKILSFMINKEKIGEVIGPGGKMIREIIEQTGTKIDITDDGTVKIFGMNKEATEHAHSMIQGIVAEAEVGKVYQGSVIKLLDFGAIVRFLGKQEGMVHISEIAQERVNDINDYVKIGDHVQVKVIGFDRGKVKLSMKQVNNQEAVSA